VTSDLALPAAQEALKRASRKPEDIDLTILGKPALSEFNTCCGEVQPLCVCHRRLRTSSVWQEVVRTHWNWAFVGGHPTEF
jgi:hypothetical protein